MICTKTCTEACPNGFSCEGISLGGPDIAFICVPETTCEDPTPYVFEGGCVACLNSTHCDVKEACDDGTHTCVVVIGDCGDTCSGPYPGCAKIEGQWTCVPCTDDEHCVGAQTCNTDTYSCE